MTEFNQTKEEQLALEINREIKVRQVIDNPEFKQFFEEYRAELVDNLIRTKGDEVDKREEFYRQLKSLGIMKVKLTKAIQTGKMARDELSIMHKAANAFKNVIG